jgi:hypothetical protein
MGVVVDVDASATGVSRESRTGVGELNKPESMLVIHGLPNRNVPPANKAQHPNTASAASKMTVEGRRGFAG